jgi:hypothetical protein
MHSRRTKAKINSAFDRPPRSEVTQVLGPKSPDLYAADGSLFR